MSRYRRVKLEGGLFFFTLALADRSSDLLVRQIEGVRQAYAIVQERRPFETVAICILPDHIHALWQLPGSDADYASRWSLFQVHILPRPATSDDAVRQQNRQAREGNLAASLLGACRT
jgi:putative transposase